MALALGRLSGLRPTTLMAALAGVGALALAVPAAWRLATARQLAHAAQPYVQQPGSPGRHLLVLGDSTAVGTGASRPDLSLVGRIGHSRPDWRIDNLAANGARAADLPAQLAQRGGTLDLVLILVGGNDVIRLSDWAHVRAQLLATVQQVRQRGGHAVLMPCGDVGHAPLFPPGLRQWMSRRSQALHAAVDEVSRATGTPVVDLRVPAAQDPFVQAPQRYHAADGLHPSDAGYAVWFDRLQQAHAMP